MNVYNKKLLLRVLDGGLKIVAKLHKTVAEGRRYPVTVRLGKIEISKHGYGRSDI